jgi:hypothetical protein
MAELLMRRALVAAVVALACMAGSAQAATPAVPPSHAASMGCKYEHPSRDSYRAASRLLKHHRPVGKETKRRVGKWAKCVATRAKAHAVHKHVRGLWKWRHKYENVWPIRFHSLPSWEQAWAVSTGACESGNNPRTSTGNGFYGAFQFTLTTWASAVARFGGGWPSNPTAASWSHQAVVAVKWKWVTSDEQWPVCGD